jgi:ADP-heptose:LPS heptosyltransferase
MILYVKNIISLVNFFFLNIFFGRKSNPENKNILFFNSEKIGDLMVSSVLLENDDVFPEETGIFFLIKKNYFPLFENYSGKINIITYDYKKYKWLLPYRFFFLKRLRNLKLRDFYNLTPARGMLNDEISLLSGANKIYATDKNKKYLKGPAGNIFDKKYDDIIYADVKNEYEKNFELLKHFSGEGKDIRFVNSKTFSLSGSNYIIENKFADKNEYIAVSPTSTDMERTWGKDNFSRLCNEIAASNKIVLIGSPKEKKILEEIKNDNENILIDTSSLKILPDIINHCRFFVGGDSGLTHIAMKLGKPLLAILDGGYFNRYFPYRTEDKNNNFIYHMMDCFGCGFDCIFDKKYCLLNISYDDVLKKVKELLSR